MYDMAVDMARDMAGHVARHMGSHLANGAILETNINSYQVAIPTWAIPTKKL